MPVSVHRLADTEQYLAVLDGHPPKFAPDEEFAYCNGGFVILALIAERASGVMFHDLVRQRVAEPAGMVDTAFLRSDELPGRAALGYLAMDGVSRTNVFHLPVHGSGDGASTRPSTMCGVSGPPCSPERSCLRTPWRRWFRLAVMYAESKWYGLGFWLHESSEVVILEGYDAGVSFRSAHDLSTQVTYTVIANTSEGAWPFVGASTRSCDSATCQTLDRGDMIGGGWHCGQSPRPRGRDASPNEVQRASG